LRRALLLALLFACEGEAPVPVVPPAPAAPKSVAQALTMDAGSPAPPTPCDGVQPSTPSTLECVLDTVAVTRGGGQKTKKTSRFDRPDSNAVGQLIVDGSANTRGTVSLNGAVLVDWSAGAPAVRPVTLPVALVQDNALEVTATGPSGSTLSVTVVDVDTTPPTVSISSPDAGTVIGKSKVSVSGLASADTKRVDVNGKKASLSGGVFEEKVPVSPGVSPLVAEARDFCGNIARACTWVERDETKPEIVFAGVVEDGLYDAGVSPSWDVVELHPASESSELDGQPYSEGTLVTSEGRHTLEVEAVDVAGNRGKATLHFELDLTAPQIAINGVTDGLVTRAAQVTPRFSANDRNLATVSATLDGAPFISNTPVTQEGLHTLVVTAVDQALNVATRTVRFTIDRTGPLIEVAGVEDGRHYRAPVTVSFSSPDADVQSLSATLDGATFSSGSIVSQEGVHTLVVTGRDTAGNTSTRTLRFALDFTAPAVRITSPASAHLTRDATIQVVAEVTEAQTVSSVTVGAVALSRGTDGLYRGTVPLAEGTNALTVTAFDAAGNEGQATVTVTRDSTPPVLSVTHPVAGQRIAALSTRADGTVVDASPTTLTLDGNAVPLAADGSFSTTVALSAGANTLHFVAADALGNSRSVDVTVRANSTPPALAVTQPSSASTTSSQATQLFEGTVTAGDATDSVSLTLNGRSVAVATNGHFSTVEPLAEGPNTFELVATDGYALTSTASFTVTRVVVVDAGQGGGAGGGGEAGGGGAAGGGVAGGGVAGGNEAGGGEAGGSTAGGGEAGGSTAGGGTAGGATAGGATAGGATAGGATAGGATAGGATAGGATAGGAPAGPPLLVIDGPSEGAVTADSPVTLTGHIDEGADPLAVTVDGVAVPLSGNTFTYASTLPEGPHRFEVEVVDALSRSARSSRNVTVDRTPPALTLTRPLANPAIVNETPVVVEGIVFEPNLTRVEVAGVPATVLAGRFFASVPVTVGTQLIRVAAVDAANNSSHVDLSVTVPNLPPTVVILSPEDGLESPGAVIDVTVQVDSASPLSSVTIGGGAAVADGTGRYRASVALAFGDNFITASATDSFGRSGSDSVRVHYRDATTEALTVIGIEPPAGALNVEPDSFISVTFNKEVDATSLATAFTVTAQGQPVAGGFSVLPSGRTVSFIARAPLPPGPVRVRVQGAHALVGLSQTEGFASDFTVRAPFTEVHGLVMDEAAKPLEGVKVEVEGQGLSTLTAANGNYNLLVPGEGTYTLRFTGGQDSEGHALPTVRRKVFVTRERQGEVEHLVLFPTQLQSTSFVGSQEEVLTFNGVHGALSVTLPQGALAFEGGATEGAVTLTQLPMHLLSVAMAQREGPQVLWQLQPAGTRLMRQPTVKLPNLFNAAPGKHAVVYGFDADTLQLIRAAVAKVDEDGTTLSLVTPYGASSLEYFGYSVVPDASEPAIAQALGETAAPPVDGGLGLLERSLEWLKGGLYGQAWAQFFGAGLFPALFIAIETGLETSIPARLSGTVRGDRDRPLDVELKAPVADGGLRLPAAPGGFTALPLEVKASLPDDYLSPGATPDTVTVTATVAHFLSDGGASTGAPGIGSVWTAQGAGLTQLTTSVDIGPRSLVTVTASSLYVSRVMKLQSFEVPDAGVDGGVMLSVRLVSDSYGFEDGGFNGASFEDGSLESIVRFPNTRVTVWGSSNTATSTGPSGNFSALIPLFMVGSGTAMPCASIPLGTRTVVSTPPGGGPKVYTARQQTFEACGVPVGLGSGFASRSDVLVDARFLYGRLSFVDKRGKPMPFECPASSGQPPLADDGGLFQKVTADDVDAVEVHFFREDNLDIPMAKFTTGATAVDCSLPLPPSGTFLATGNYGRLRIGPQDSTHRATRARCRAVEAAGKADAGDADADGRFYNSSCRDNRNNFLRLRPGDRMVAFAVSHRNGFAGLKRFTVPPINRPSPGCVNATDAGIRVVENGVEGSISPCLQQELGINVPIDLYPPEVEVRVQRTIPEEGIPQTTQTLVRTGGGATNLDKTLMVSTHWRVRTAPLPLFDGGFDAGVDAGSDGGSDGGSDAGASDAGVRLGYCIPGVHTDGGPCPIGPLRDAPDAGFALEVYCEQLSQDSSPESLAVCISQAELTDVPSGVPPLAGRLATVSGGSVTVVTPPPSSFPVPPGRRTHWVQTATVTSASGLPTNGLSAANYYVHVVGRSVWERDKDMDGVLQDNEREVPPPDFTQTSPTPGLPDKAIVLKGVYRSWERQGRVERYDLAREHEFRLLNLEPQRVFASGPDGGLLDGGTYQRDMRDGGTRPSAEEGDVAYTLLMSLIEPNDAPRAGTLSGTYVVRLGSDESGIDCAVTLDATTHRLSGTCDGADIEEVISAGDILYLELYLSGNAENVLYRFNFEGLKPRTDYVAASTEYIEQTVTTKEPVGTPPTRGRPVSQRPIASCTVSPVDMRHGLLKLCTSVDCALPADVVKQAELHYLNGHYTVTDLPGGQVDTPFTEKGPTGIEGAERFNLPLPNHIAQMQGVVSSTVPPRVWCRLEPTEAGKGPVSKALGTPKGSFEGAHAFAAGQVTADGLNIVDGHLSFTHEDFSVPLLATRLSFARTYNNQSNEVTALGTGWHHNWDVVLREEYLDKKQTLTPKRARYVMLMAGQGYGFMDCPAPDAVSNPTGTCDAQASGFRHTDGTHGMTLAFAHEGGNLVFTVTDLNGIKYRFDKPAVAGTDDGRRRWLLTYVGDGHEGASLTPSAAGACDNDRWCLTYLPGTNLLDAVKRPPGKVSLKFQYTPMPMGPHWRARSLANIEGLQELIAVKFVVDGQSAPLQELGFEHFAPGVSSSAYNLLSAATKVGAPNRKWQYSYLPPPGGGTSWELSNELSKAEELHDGQVQWRGAWPKRATSIPSGFSLLKPGEVVTEEVLPGQEGLPTKVDFASPRTVTRYDGAVFKHSLNSQGNSTRLQTGAKTRSTPYDNTQAEQSVRQKSFIDGTLRETETVYSTTPGKELLPEEQKLITPLPGAVSCPSLAAGTLSKVVSRNARFNTPEVVELSIGQGKKATWTSTLSPAGELLAQAVTDTNGGSYTLMSGGVRDASGRLTFYIDGLGREHTLTYVAADTFGLPRTELVTHPAAAPGTLSGLVRTFGYDSFGRLTSIDESPTGAHQEFKYDALGRLEQKLVAATPNEDWRYSRDAGDNSLTVTERCVDSSRVPADEHQRVTTLVDGQLVGETLRVGRLVVGPAGAPVEVTTTADAGYVYSSTTGKLATATDMRGVLRSYEYESTGERRLIAIQTSASGLTGGDALDMRAAGSLDAEGRAKAAKDSQGRARAFELDGLGRTALVKSGPLSGDPATGGQAEVQTCRDAQGAVVRQKYGKALVHELVFTPDARGAPLAIASSGTDTSVDEERQYDSAGNLTFRHDKVAGLTEEWAYADALGRLTRYTRTVKRPGTSDAVLNETHAYDDVARPRLHAVTKSIGGAAGGATRTEVVTYELDAAGRVLAVKRDVSGVPATTRLTYNGRGQVKEIREESTGTVTTRYFDAAGRLIGEKNPRGGITRVTRDGEGNVVAVDGPHPLKHEEFVIDALGRVQRRRETSETGALVEFSYADAASGALKGRQESVAFGGRTRTVTHFTNAGGQLLKRVTMGTPDGPTAFTETLTWDGEQLAEAIEEEGNWRQTSRATYDARGRAGLAVDSFSGGGRSYVYQTSMAWSVVSGAQRALNTFTWSVDGQGLTAVPSPSTEDFDGNGNVVARTMGVVKDTWLYDAAGELAESKASGGALARFTYDSSGHLSSRVLAPGTSGAEVTSVSFDGDGRPLYSREPTGRALHRTHAYVTGGETVTEAYGDVAPDGTPGAGGVVVTQTRYFGTGEREEVTRAFGTTDAALWRYSFGPRGLLASVAQSAFGQFDYSYDGLRRLTLVTPPAGSPTPPQRFEYDGLGRPTLRARGSSSWTSSWSNGVQTETAPSPVSDESQRLFDGRGRLLKVQYVPIGSASASVLTSKSFSYDGFGALVSLREGRPSATDVDMAWHYDGSHLLTSVTRDGTGTTYTYGAAVGSSRNPLTLSVAGAGATMYGYDALDRLELVTPQGLGDSVQVRWEAGGERLLSLRGAAVDTFYCHDVRGRLRQLVSLPSALGPTFACPSPMPVSSTPPTPPATATVGLGYGVDERGNRVVEERVEAGVPSTRRFGYDSSDRLTGELLRDGTFTAWQLNPDGTRGFETRYPSASMSPLGGTGTPLSSQQYFYDGQGALERIEDAINAGPPVASFVVDAAGRRRGETRVGVALTKTLEWDVDGRLTQATVSSGSSVKAASYTYDGLGLRRRAEVHAPPGNPVFSVRSWEWGGESGSELVAEAPAGSLPQLYSQAGGVGLSQGGQRWAPDAVGSVAARVNASTGTVLSLERYDAWGEAETPPAASQASAAYAGQLWDDDVGLSFARQRAYDARTASWLSPDPLFGSLENPSSLLTFGYANGNPVRFTDPSGLMPPGGYAVITNKATADICLEKGKDSAECRSLQRGQMVVAGVSAGVTVGAAGAVFCAANPALCVGVAAAGVGLSGEPTLRGADATVNACVEAQSNEQVFACTMGVSATATGIVSAGAPRLFTPRVGAQPFATPARLVRDMGWLVRGADGVFVPAGEAAVETTALARALPMLAPMAPMSPVATPPWAPLIRSVGQVGAGNTAPSSLNPEGFYALRGARASRRMAGQEGENSCGIACVRELLRREGVEVTEEALWKELGIPRDARALEVPDLSRLLARYSSQPYKAGGRYPSSTAADPTTPYIALLKPVPYLKATGHYVIVEGVSPNGVRLSDPWGPTAPSPGPARTGRLPASEFEEFWENSAKSGVYPASEP